MKELILIILLAFLLAVGPMVTIWAINTLFSTQIPLNLATWFAAFWVSYLIGGPRVRY